MRTPSSVLIVAMWHSMFMKAVLCKQYGPPESLTFEELPSPRPGPGEVVVSVKAASVNFPDVLIIQNKYQFKPPLPFSPGSELAGVVKEVGPGVQGFRAGDRVMAFTTYGAFAEEVKTEASRLIALPEKMDFVTGAAFLLTYATSDHALREGRGVDVVYDPVGGPYTEPAFRSLAWRGRLLVVGFAAGEIPKLPLNLALLKGAAVVGVFWGDFTRREPQRFAESVGQLAKWWAEGRLKPHVSQTMPLEKAADALKLMAARQVKGKLVLTVGNSGSAIRGQSPNSFSR